MVSNRTGKGFIVEWEAWVLVIDLAISGVYVLVRGMNERRMQHTPWEGVGGALEALFMIWLVLRLAGVM